MFRRINALHVLAATVLLLAVLLGLGLATREDPAKRPYLDFAGGGFIFNYRVAEVFYGFNLVVTKPLEAGSIIEAEFEDPGGGPSHLVSTRVNPRTTKYTLRSPSVRGVEAGKPYAVTVSLWDWRHEKLIERHQKSYVSQTSDIVVPETPLTVGPGYHTPPDRKTGG